MGANSRMGEAVRVQVTRSVRAFAACAWLIGFLAISASALAQGVAPSTPDDLRRAYDAAFEAMYRDPGDLDKTFAFAGLAVQVGDFEGAIAALERMLVVEPDLPRVRLELGVLYFRLGSYEVAATYFDELLADEAVPESIKDQVRAFSEEVESRTSRHRFTGSLYGGLRYQSNAIAGPNSNSIRLLGNDAVLDDQFTSQGDADAFLSAQASHVYDFETEPSKTFETDLSIYANEQSDQSSVNTRFFDLRIGPRLALPRAWVEDVEVRPFLNGDYLTLGGEETFASYGAGLTARWRATDTLELQGDGRFLVRDYNNSDSSPGQDAANGHRHRYGLGTRYLLTPSTVLRAGLALARDEAKTASQSNWEYGVSAAVQHSFQAPFALTAAPWTTSLDLYASVREYDGPNPVIDPDETRNDEIIRTNLLLTIPLGADLAMILTGGFAKVDSTLPNFEYDNFSASVGFLRRF